jgi:DNA-binding NarL/FixJ family response regulator
VTGQGHRIAPARVAILADDVIWATRLEEIVQAAGGVGRRLRTAESLEGALADLDAVIVDLTARAYDGVAAIAMASGSGVRILAVGQHDDQELRRRAVAAGAERVLPYRRLFEDGPTTVAKWLAATPASVASTGLP